jgi:REP element-mobilizing transposase RayT
MSQNHWFFKKSEFRFRNRYRIPSARLRGWDYASDGYYFVTICGKDRFPCFAKIIGGKVHLSPIGEIIAEEWENTAKIRKIVNLDAWEIMPDHLHGIIEIIHPDPIMVNSPHQGHVDTRPCDNVETFRYDNVEPPRYVNVETLRYDIVETPRYDNVETPRYDNVETPRYDNAETPRYDHVEPPRYDNVETPRRGVSTLKPDSLGSIIGQFKSKSTKRVRAMGYCDFGWQPRFYDHIIRDEADLQRIRRYIQANPARWKEINKIG